MDQTIEVAKQFPDVKFEHCTGYKHADNVGTYNSRFHQGRAVEGTIAGHMSKSGVIGYLGSYKVPEVVLGVNAFTLAAQAVNPKITDQAHHDRLLVRPGQGGRGRPDADQPRLRRHRPAHRQPAGLQVCEQHKAWCFGQGADMKKFAPKTQLTAIEDIWGPYYISRAKAVLDGSWKPDDAWWGFKEGTVVMSPFSSAMPDDVKAAAEKVIAGWKDGSYDVFTGEIKDQSGTVSVAKGAADGRQGPRRHRLVRPGRAELNSGQGNDPLQKDRRAPRDARRSLSAGDGGLKRCDGGKRG